MFNLLSLVLAGAAAAAPAVTPVAVEQPEQRITLSARPFFSRQQAVVIFYAPFYLWIGSGNLVRIHRQDAVRIPNRKR